MNNSWSKKSSTKLYKHTAMHERGSRYGYDKGKRVKIWTITGLWEKD